MEIVYKNGDMLLSSEDILVHGCNAMGKMNSGVAKAIRNKYPEAFDVYYSHYKQNGLNVGDNIYVPTHDSKLIVNMITQQFYGYDKKLYVSYDGIRECFKKLNTLLHDDDNILNVAMPKIGSDRGGGCWDIISNIIEEESIYFQPIVYIFTG